MLTGNAIVGQSGGPTAAINATLSGVIRGALTAKKEQIIGKLYGMRNGIEGVLQKNYVDLTELFGGNQCALSDLEHTPAAALGSCRKKLPDDPADEIYEELFAEFNRLDIRYFFYIGGNDSMDTVAKLSRAAERRQYDMRIVGVPKTIDNDLAGTDHTPGYGSAAKYIAVSVEEIIRDCSVYTVPAVTIVEIMGRDAGWLTAAAALPLYVFGEGPDLVYLPERPFSVEGFLSDVRSALSRHPGVVVAVSEGIRNENGEYIGSLGQSGALDAFGHKYLAGTGKVLENIVKDYIGCKVRSIELSLPQRCAAHIASKTDLEESIMIGSEAVSAAVSGKTGCVMSFCRNERDSYDVTVTTIPVSEVANLIRKVPTGFINQEGNGITEDCLRYLLPLIQGEATPRFVNGLPYQLKI